MKNIYFVVFALFFAGFLTFTSCAKRGTITGGPKDTIAPVLVNAILIITQQILMEMKLKLPSMS